MHNQDPIEIRDYDPGWPAMFEQFAARARAVIGPSVLRVEHVGSTAVPGLAAKPVIDLDVVLAAQSDLPKAIRRLESLGYQHEGDLGIEGREALRCPPGEPRHHLYVMVEGAPELTRHLAFRDALCRDSTLREQYMLLKRSLAARHPNERDAYSDGKSEFINTVLAQSQATPPGSLGTRFASPGDSRDEYELALIDAIRKHPEIQAAALTGSRARAGGSDEYSDVDMFLVARNVEAVRRVREWLPSPEKILLCDFHQQRYCSVLLEDFSRIDLAIYDISESPSSWVIQHHQLIKGTIDNNAQFDAAENITTRSRAVHLNSDASIDNLLMLLVTARRRAQRGEESSAHAWLAAAWDMTVSLFRKCNGVGARTDLLDTRRRIESEHPALAAALQRSLFGRPEEGVSLLVEYLKTFLDGRLSDAQRRVLAYLGPRSGL